MEDEIVNILNGFVETYVFDKFTANIIHPDDIPSIAKEICKGINHSNNGR